MEEMVALTLTLLLERGYDNTPMSLLAKTLGLTKPGVYHHFKSKENLLYTVHKHTLKRKLIPILDKAEREADPMERLKIFMLEFTAMMTRDPSPGVLIREARRLSPEHLEEFRKVWRRQFELVRGAIAKLQNEGRCRKDVNPTFAAFAAINLVTWTFEWFDYSRPHAADEVAKTLLAVFMNGIVGSSQQDSK